MKFSICIPNYNYEKYIARTIRSVLDQESVELEVLVSDNASTDRSVEVVSAIGDSRVHLKVNACNVGFASNLDRAARQATGDWLIMLSSDDLMRPGALATYRAFVEAIGAESDRSVISSAMDLIDPQDQKTGSVPLESALWTAQDRAPALDAVAGGPVYRVSAPELLRRCLSTMKNPFNFAATAYPRALYDAVEGYGGGRVINPDKWFHWKLLSVAEEAYFIDRPLFAYRWHPANQTAQQAASGALKYLVDEYVSTLEMPGDTLERCGLKRDDVVAAFVEHDIARHGLATLARGEDARARRILLFGRSVYPSAVQHNWKTWALGVLLNLGPLGRNIARAAYERWEERNRA